MIAQTEARLSTGSRTVGHRVPRTPAPPEVSSFWTLQCEQERTPLTDSTLNEHRLYGATWNTLYDGYFADAAVASPLVEAVLDAARSREPAVIADLGGGTGFILGEILRNMDGHAASPRLVCVDIAREQLGCCPEPITTLECSVEDLRRDMLASEGESLMLCMRSVLHYLGMMGMKPDLGRLRSVLEKGEHLVHQTICFESEREQEVANLLYELMGTEKWYPTTGYLVEALVEEGFSVTDARPAASLPISSMELERRYGVGHEEMTRIGMRLEALCEGRLSTVYHPSRNGFTVYLDYVVLTCEAD